MSVTPLPTQQSSAGPVVVPTVPAKPGAVASPVPSPPPRPVATARPAPGPAAAAPKPATQASPSPEPPQSAWRPLFEDWPAEINKRGIVITQQNEPCQFKAFMLRGDFVLLERVAPDSMGGRFLVLPYDEIAALKFTDPLKQPALEAAGFAGQLAK